jgi:hypothetical protein
VATFLDICMKLYDVDLADVKSAHLAGCDHITWRFLAILRLTGFFASASMLILSSYVTLSDLMFLCC